MADADLDLPAGRERLGPDRPCLDGRQSVTSGAPPLREVQGRQVRGGQRSHREHQRQDRAETSTHDDLPYSERRDSNTGRRRIAPTATRETTRPVRITTT